MKSKLKTSLFFLVLWLGLPFGCVRRDVGGAPVLPQSSALNEASSRIEPAKRAENQLRLGGRTYVASMLKYVFGPSADRTVEILIEDHVMAMGGESCQPYRNDCEGNDGLAGWSPFGDSVLPSIPRATTLRAALISRACHGIVAKDEAILFATANVLGGALSTMRQPTEADILAAFNEFSPGRSLNDESAKQLLNVTQRAGEMGMLEAWRFLFLTLCLEPGWQIP